MCAKLGANAWPILIPIGAEDNLIGQIDVVNQKAIIYSTMTKSLAPSTPCVTFKAMKSPRPRKL
jgi:hypothetical protein